MALLADSEVEPVIAGLVGSISTADGPTDEQLTSGPPDRRRALSGGDR